MAKSINTRRPTKHKSRRPYMPPPKITAAGKQVRAFMKRIKRGVAG